MATHTIPTVSSGAAPDSAPGSRSPRRSRATRQQNGEPGRADPFEHHLVQRIRDRRRRDADQQPLPSTSSTGAPSAIPATRTRPKATSIPRPSRTPSPDLRHLIRAGRPACPARYNRPSTPLRQAPAPRPPPCRSTVHRRSAGPDDGENERHHVTSRPRADDGDGDRPRNSNATVVPSGRCDNAS